MHWLKSNSYLVVLLLLIIFSLPAISPLFHPGFFLTDDGEWMVIRFSAFYQALADGQFPVRFLHRLNFDYGYPVSTFLYPGFMYAGVLFHILKIGFVDTIKIIFGVSLLGTTVFVYLWLLKLFNNKLAAFTGAVMSLYLPYHLYDVYTRGSVGEIFALVWVAFTLWMLEKKNAFFVSIGIALILLSHNTLALLFLPFLFSYALIRNIFPFKKLLIIVFLGISLTAFFIIPAVFELSFTNFSKVQISNPLHYFANIRIIGFETILIFLLSLVLLFSKKKINSDNKLLTSFFLFVTFLCIVMSTSFSSIFWQIIPSAFIQFPFRLLSYFVITTAFLSAFVISEIKHLPSRIVILLCFAGMIIFSSIPFMQPKVYFDKTDGYYFTNEATTTVQDEYMPVWSKEKVFQKAEKKVEVIHGQGKVDNINYNNKQMTFSINAHEDVRVRINSLYWPGWIVFVDNQRAAFSYENKNGVIEVAMPKGMHQVKAEFGETPLRVFADMISVVSFVSLLYFGLVRRKNNY